MRNESLYHLDLCILAYQLHAQTLIWPLDPYYEQMRDTYAFPNPDPRDNLMSLVRAEKKTAYCSGSFEVNPDLDPIQADYTRLCPWLPTFTRVRKEETSLAVYCPPAYIVNRIKVTRMCGLIPNESLPKVIEVGINHDKNSGTDPMDELYGFEGPTGSIYENLISNKGRETPPWWSFMGFVLVENIESEPGDYNIRIIFRGSRSGGGGWEKEVAFTTGSGSVNPDWLTNGDFNRNYEAIPISLVGCACRGFATSVHRMLPSIIACLAAIQGERARRPREITVAGHSLGGALAVHFASAVVCGGDYGPDGKGKMMGEASNKLPAWPWGTMKVFTYAAPVVGDYKFQQHLGGRLCCVKRFWAEGDWVTQAYRHYHVGEPLPLACSDKSLSSKDLHKPMVIRRLLIERLEKLDKITLADAQKNIVPWSEEKSLKAAVDSVLMHVPSLLEPKKRFPILDKTFHANFIKCMGYYTKLLDQLLPHPDDPLPTISEEWEKFIKILIKIAGYISKIPKEKPQPELWQQALNKLEAETQWPKEDYSLYLFLWYGIYLSGLSQGFSLKSKRGNDWPI